MTLYTAATSDLVPVSDAVSLTLAQVTQASVRALIQDTAPSARVTQESVRAVVQDTAPSARITQLSVRVLRSRPHITLGTAKSYQAGTPYATIVAADAPILWWKMDEASGSTLANSGSGGATDNGTLAFTPAYHDPTLLPFGQADPSMGYDGGSGHIVSLSTALALATSSFTIEMVVKPSNLAASTPKGLVDVTTEQILSRIGDSGLSLGQVQIGYDGSGRVTTPVCTANGVVHHILWTYDATTGNVAIYVDGVSQATGTGWPTGGLGTRWNGPIRFPWNNSNGREMAGDFQHLAIYNYVLSSTRIALHGALGSANGFVTKPVKAWDPNTGAWRQVSVRHYSAGSWLPV